VLSLHKGRKSKGKKRSIKMKRRTFIKALFGAAAAAVAAPIVCKAAVAKEVLDPVPFEELPIDVYKTFPVKSKAVWSEECAADLRSMHNIDAEKELTALLSEEINKEIDKEVLDSFVETKRLNKIVSFNKVA
jgi:hypothetical protein